MIMIMGDLETSRRLADEESPTSSSPFTCSGDWCTAEDKYFLFPKGVNIGKRNTACTYGKGVLSVDNYNDVQESGSNCAAGNGSIVSGTKNSAIGTGSVAIGGASNAAGSRTGVNGDLSVIAGGGAIIKPTHNIQCY